MQNVPDQLNTGQTDHLFEVFRRATILPAWAVSDGKEDNNTLDVDDEAQKYDAGTRRTSVGRGARSDTGVGDVAKKSLVPMWVTALGRAAALSLACADTDTSSGKTEGPKEGQGGSAKIGYYEWHDNGVQRCFAGSDDEQEPADEGDAGDADEDLPTRTCVHCSLSSRYLLQCANCHQFTCIRCLHRCGPQCGDERFDRLGLSRWQ